MIEVETPNGKKIQLILDPKRTAYKFQFVPGGELPEELSGVFMAERHAKVALARYLDKVAKKKNAERQG